MPGCAVAAYYERLERDEIRAILTGRLLLKRRLKGMSGSSRLASQHTYTAWNLYDYKGFVVIDDLLILWRWAGFLLYLYPLS